MGKYHQSKTKAFKRKRPTKISDKEAADRIMEIREEHKTNRTRVRMDLENFMLAILLDSGFELFVDAFQKTRAELGWYE